MKTLIIRLLFFALGMIITLASAAILVTIQSPPSLVKLAGLVFMFIFGMLVMFISNFD